MAQVLAINSQVAYGHVGAEAAAFALRRLGHEVCLIPTVQFSNHPGHGGYRGGPVAHHRAENLLQGMLERDLLQNCAAIHSGYLGDGEMARIVLAARQALPEAIYCCDPVMGDGGQVYVKDNVVQAIAQDLVPSANIVTPNAFELSLLTDLSVKNLDEARIAARQLISLGPALVLCSSAAIENGQIATLAVTANEAWVAWTPLIENAPHGTGDTLAAIFLGRYLQSRDFWDVLELSVASVQGLIAAGQEDQLKDIAIVKGQDQIVAPTVIVSVERLVD